MKIVKTYFIGGIISGVAVMAILLVLIGSFLFDIGINSKYFIKNDFNKAFQYRVTGDCASFINYIYQDSEEWKERCEKEKSSEKEPIRKFKIIAVTHKFGSDKAFLQAELTRNIEIKEDYDYSVSYEMKKSGSIWKITNEIK